MWQDLFNLKMVEDLQLQWQWCLLRPYIWERLQLPKNLTSRNICRNSLYWQTHGARGGTYCKTERAARYISVAFRTPRMQRVRVCVQLDISQALAWLLWLMCGPSVNMSALETAQHACTTHSVHTVVPTASRELGVHKTLAKLMLCLVTSLHLFCSSSCAYKDLFFPLHLSPKSVLSVWTYFFTNFHQKAKMLAADKESTSPSCLISTHKH